MNYSRAIKLPNYRKHDWTHKKEWCAYVKGQHIKFIDEQNGLRDFMGIELKTIEV
jgi:hypothetical protein